MPLLYLYNKIILKKFEQTKQGGVLGSFKTLTKKKNNKWVVLAIFSFFISLFCASAWFISNAWFRDQDSMNNDVNTAAVQIENNTKYSMSTVVNLALADQYLLDKDVTFNITEKSSEVYVRCALRFTCTSGAEVAKDMIKFQAYELGTNAGYSWQQFGEYYYLCDETGIPKTIERSQAGQIFTFVEKENLLLPRDAIVGKHFTSNDQVTMTVEIEAIQGRNLEDSSIYELNQYFLTDIPSDTYTVKFHEADGTILSEQANIAYGANAIVPEIEKVKSADHTTFAYWSTTEDGEGLKIREDDETRIFSNISQNMEVWPVYAHDQVRIDVSYGEGGKITPGSTTIDWGTGKTFRVVADSGHAIQQIKRDGVVIYDFSGSKIDMFDYVLENVVADTQIEATFEPVTYEIIVITVGNGTVDPGTTTAVFGSSKVFTITPDKGHRIWSITLDGVDMPVTASSGNAQRFTISDINSDHILSVKFVTSILKITTVAGTNGTIRPRELEVEYDSFASVSIVPNEGYEIASIYIDGVKVDDSKVAKGGVAQNVSFEHVTEDHVVRATFSKIKLTISASAGEGGLISPAGEIGCEYGATVSFDITPDPQKTIDKIYVDGAEVAITVTEGDKQTCVFENIKESHTIYATFKRSYIRLDINGGTGSQPSISYSIDGTKFTLSNVEPKGPGGKEFYYYSTRAFDNERGQLGDRYDLGYEYDIPDMNSTTTLYAIYLEPTPDVSVYSTYMVIPKGTQTLKRIGFEEAMNEVMKNSGDNVLAQIIALMLGIVLSTTQKDTNLVYCTLPAGLTTLEFYAFSGCVSLTGVSVPASLSSISLHSFSNTTSLESFTVPYSCVSLGSNVFENSGVQHIKMNKKLQSIGTAAFKNSGLNEFNAQSSITSMGKVDSLFSGNNKDEYKDDVFHDCANLEKLDFSEQSSFLGQTFQNCTALKEVVLPQPLTTIPDNQFRNCQSLTQVSYKNGDTLVNKFPSTLKKIGAYSFYSCSFTDLLLSDCQKVSIGEYAFAANAFENLVVENGKVSEVGAYAFSSCSNLKTVNWEIEYNVPEYCFAYSSNLQSFKTTSIKDGIMEYAFVDCLKLDSVDIKNNGAEFIISAGAFKNCVIANMVFPEGITTIGSQAFYGNLFKEIVFPSTLLNLATDSLQSCSRLEKFELKVDLTSTITNLNKIGNGPTWYIEGEPYLVGTERSSAPDGIGPKGVYTIYPGKANRIDWEWIEVVSDTQIKRYTTSTDSNGNKTTVATVENTNYPGTEIGKKYITKYIPETVESGTLNIVIPNAVIDLGGTIHDIDGIISFEANDVVTQKFTNGDIVNLELMSGLTYVGANCFNNTIGKKLSSISVPMSIKYVGESAFQGTKISSVKLSNLEYIGANAFASCENLTSAELSNSITEIPDSCFQYSGLTSFVMPEFLTKIGGSAFVATNLTKIYLPSTLSEIGANAFADCSNLVTVEGLSNTKITEIQTQTFNRCSKLNKVYFPLTLKSIAFWAFNACTNLTYVTFGSSLEQIDMYAFSYCSKLSSLDFPATLSTIGMSAFVGCSSLVKVTFSHISLANISVGASAFGETTSALVVYIQNTVALADYKAKFDGTTTDRGFAEDATLFYQNAKTPLAFYKSKEWKAVQNVVVYCGEGGSATIKFGTGSETTIQSFQQKTFNIINGTNYELLIYPDQTTDFFALIVNSISHKNDLEKFGTGNRNRKFSSTVDGDTQITITFNKPVVYLDENGANGTNWKKHEIEEGVNKETFTIRDNAENFTKDGKPFYFYSTIKTDNESKQVGKRFDVGVTYPVSSLHGVKTLYAIYLTPTAESNFTMDGGTISLKDEAPKIENLVIPKMIGDKEVTGIAARGFSDAEASGYIDGDTITSKISGLITMPSTITTIGERAFAGNSEISSMFSFPYALKNLGKEAFALCNFTAVNINLMVTGSNVVKFENNILYTTDGAYQFALGTKATSISDIDATAILPHAFANSDIKTFNDFGKITTYGAYAFADCNSIELVMTFTKKASQITFGEGVFEGTSAKLRIYVPSGDVENYITKFTSQLGFQNGTLIYNGSDSTIPYAQYYNDDKNDNWKRIYKVTTSTLPTGGKSITIYNLSAQEDKSMTFEVYSKAFSGNIEGYYREDWKLSVVVISDSEGGYTLKTFEIGKKQSNGTFNYSKISLSEGKYDTSGSQFTYEIASYSRKEDWDIRVTFEYKTQNVKIYVDAGMNTSTLTLPAAFEGPTLITTGEYNGYKLYSATYKFGSTFTITTAEPNKSYIIISIKFREKIYNEAAGQYSWSDWQNISCSNFAKINSDGFNSLNDFTSSKISNDIEFVIQTQYSSFILSISGTNEPLGLKYDSSTKQYKKISDGVNLVQTNFTSVTIPEDYDKYEQGSSELYYFINNGKRFDTGISYPKAEFTQNTSGYYILEAKLFTPIPAEYYDTSLSGAFKLTKKFTLNGEYAIPKTIGGSVTTTILSNLDYSSSQYYQISTLTLPKTVVDLEEGAFAMSKISGQVYFPSKLTGVAEGSLTTTGNVKFNQTRLSSITYAFAISNDKNYITISNVKTLVCANSNITVSSIPSGITKLGAYLFAGRSIGEYSDASNSVQSYGKGVFFNTTISNYTFTKSSNTVSFDGLLLNPTGKVSVYVADDGYITKLNNRGFWSYAQTRKESTNNYTSMYISSNLLAIYRNDAWQKVYFYTHDGGSTYQFISIDKMLEFKDNGKTYIADRVLNYTIRVTSSMQMAIVKIEYYKYKDLTVLETKPYTIVAGDPTESVKSKNFEITLENNTHVAITIAPTQHNIFIEFAGYNQELDTFVLDSLDMTKTFDASVVVELDGVEQKDVAIEKREKKFHINNVPFGSYVSITLTNTTIGSIFCIASYANKTVLSDNKTFGQDYEGVVRSYTFSAFEMPGQAISITAYISILPIALNKNGGTGFVPSYSTAQYGENYYTFNIDDVEGLSYTNADFYYFSDDKDALDFSDNRYDTGNTYTRLISELLSETVTRTTLYARFATYVSDKWTINSSGFVAYSGSGASGSLLSSTGQTSTEFLVVPSIKNYTKVKGLAKDALNTLTSKSVKYILLPGGEFVTIGATMFGTSNAVTKIQLPSGISSIAVATFQKASKLTDFILNESLESNYSTPNGVLYNSNRTILYAHPRQKEMTSSTILGTISTIEEYACYECDLGTAELNLPDATQIKQRAFQNAGGIKSVTFGNALQTVAQYAFYGCPNLQSAQNIANVEDCAFMNCNSLETTTFNSNCSTIGVSGFENCLSLISCQFSTSLKSISNRSFYATGLTNANLKDVLYLGVESFANCNDLSSITLSENLTYIPQYCFYNCGLTTLTIPANVTIIDRYSFKNNTSLTVIVFNGAPNSINGSSFENAESIEYIQLKTTFKTCWGGITKRFLYSLNNIKSGVWRYSETKITNNSFVKTKSVLELKDIGFYYFIADNNVSVQVDGDSTLYWYNSLSSAFNSKASGNTSVVTMYADDSIYSELNINSETNITLEATNKYIVTIYRGSASTATRNREIFHITGGSMKMGTKNNNLILDGNKDADSLGDNISSMIYIEEGSFVMNGGKIQNCIADNGGAIYIEEEGATTLKGGIIQNCVARINGGAILNNGSLSISSVKLQSNEANERGGAIATKGNFRTSNNAIIEKNSAAIDGGGIYLFGNNGRVTLQNVIIKSNKAAYGGGVYIRGGLTVYLWTGCAISNNTASSLGGGLFSAASADNKVQFHGATISYNTANDGAGVYLEGGSYGNYYTGTISYNTADTSKGNGGGIFTGKNSKFFLGYNSADKLNISNNKAYRGAGVYITDAEYCYMRTNTIISYNDATQDGGGIYYEYHSSLYRSGINIYCTINYNKANYGGGIYFKSDKLEEINAGPKISNVTIQGNTGRVFGSALFLNHAAVVVYGQTFIYGQYYAMDRGRLYIYYDEDWSNTGEISVLGNKKGAVNGFATLYGSGVTPKYWMERYVKYFNYNGQYGPTTAWLT